MISPSLYSFSLTYFSCVDLNMADSRDRDKERENREKGIESRKRRGVGKSRSPSPLGKRGPRKIVQIIYLGLAVKYVIVARTKRGWFYYSILY